MKKRNLVVLALLVSSSMLFANGTKEGQSSSASGKQVRLTFSNVTSQSGKDGGELFKKVAEEASNGTLLIDLFPDNQLGDDRVVIETTQFGDIDIGVSSTSPIATMYPDFYAFDAPYLFLNPADAYAKLDGEIGQKILDNMSSIGLKGLGFWENGFRDFTNDKVPVKVPSDVKGLKVRVMENQVHIAAWKSWGANPTPMAFTEVFTGLQQGVIDAEENPLGIIDANKFQEVQDYVSLTQHVYTPYFMVMNLDKFNSLTDLQKEAIMKASQASIEYQRSQSQKYEGEITKKLIAGGTIVTEVSDAEKAQWRQLAEDAGVYDLVAEKMDHPEFLTEWLK